MAAGGNSDNIGLGAGRLYVAALGTAEPTDASSALPSAWRPVGYTEDGTTFTADITSDPVEVAEELEPVRWDNSSRRLSVAFSMAEVTRRNLALALSIGAAEANTAEYLEPPTVGSEVAVMLVWDSDETPSAANSRWLFRQAKPSGSIAIQRNKTPNKALIPVTFNLEKPSGLQPFRVYPDSAGRV